MIRILLVEDEYYFRQALKIMLSWETLGMEICGEADNGREALEKVKTLKPDIALVDINMPVMDGLEFVQALKETDCALKIIFITGYSEFNYARQAVQLGIYDYLLKPVKRDELEKTVLNLGNIIKKEKSFKIEVDSLKKQASESLPVIRDRVLNSALQGNLPQEKELRQKKLDYLGFKPGLESYQVVVMEIGPVDKTAWNEEDKELCRFAASNIAADILGEYYKYVTCYDNDERACIVLHFENTGEVKDCDEAVAACERIRDSAGKFMKVFVSIGIGNVYSDIEGIAVSYKEALYALKSMVMHDGDRVALYSSISDSGLAGNAYSMEQRGKLLMEMRLANTIGASNLIGQVFHKLKTLKLSADILFITCAEMISTCIEYLSEARQYENEIMEKLLGLMDEINHIKTLDEIEKRIKDLLMDAILYVGRNKSTKTARLVENVKKYIQDNFSNEDLRIEDVARHLYINYSYLCNVFKREAGMTVNDFLTEVRIQKARELIDQGNEYIQDVAGIVGYSDANYFGKCFKKYFGVSPAIYIQTSKYSL